jgi:hypothetical protein
LTVARAGRTVRATFEEGDDRDEYPFRRT